MASAFSHAIVASSLATACPREVSTRRLLLAGIFSSVVPDIDSIGFAYGVAYESFWGYRGFTHSLVFAFVLSVALTCVFFRKPGIRFAAVVYLFVCAASHGVLDAFTNGGLGVAFLSPFATTRYFFSFRPVLVSPISVQRFFTSRGAEVLVSECKWIWLPSIVFILLATLFQKWRSDRAA